MKFTNSILIAALFVAFATSTPAQEDVVAETTSYIIKLKKGVPQTKLTNLFTPSLAAANKIKYTYKPTFFNGLAGDFTPQFLAQIKKTLGKDIQYIEKNGIVTAFAQQADPPSWGQRRISTRKLDLKSPFIYPNNAGRGINVYVLDTGLQSDHDDFGGRAKLDNSIVKGETVPDGNGHGTHCAGTIGSKTYGVAKNVNILGVKVLNGAGSGTYADVIAGIQYVAGKASANPINTVMSMSLGGPTSQAVNDAIDAGYAKGVVSIVAAGNNNGDACAISPAGASKAFTVGATDNTDARASYSNWGKCVKIFAPGSNIISLWKGAKGATNTISGTSMATPHVAGVAALYLAEKKFTSVQAVYDALVAAGTKNEVKNPGVGSPNVLLYSQNSIRQ